MISRATLSGVVQGQPKYRSMLAGNTAYSPAAFESIATATGTGSSASITFSSIPSTYKHLQVRFIGRSTNANLASSVIVNGSTTGYSRHWLYGSLGTVGQGGTASLTSFSFLDTITGSNSTAGMMGTGILDIHDYASTTKNKTFRFFGGYDTNGGSDAEVISLQSALWANTSAITSITFRTDGASSNWTTNSTFALYGIKGA
jgi:hypothetical protein